MLVAVVVPVALVHEVVLVVVVLVVQVDQVVTVIENQNDALIMLTLDAWIVMARIFTKVQVAVVQAVAQVAPVLRVLPAQEVLVVAVAAKVA